MEARAVTVWDDTEENEPTVHVGNQDNLRTLLRTLRSLQAFGNESRLDMKSFFSGVRDLEVYSKVALIDVHPEDRSPDPTGCGTAACIAGWCQMIGAKDEAGRKSPALIFAWDWLGLDENSAIYLFCGGWAGKCLDEITLAETLAYLDTLLDPEPESVAPDRRRLVAV
jgi:hypothetical protein